MLQVAQQCLNANQRAQGPGSIFQKLFSARADMALVLIQRLVHTTLPAKDITYLLDSLVGTINTVEEPFAPDSISYYRTLLKTLFVTLRAYSISDSDGKDDNVALSSSQTVLNLLDRVVGRGFRSMVSLIHDDDAIVAPDDLALLTAILQACLCLPGMEQSQSQVLNIMAGHDVTHAATSLFSWADKLTDNGDPLYGELTILFLLELSTMPLIAEQLASDGILGSLLSSNLIKFMRKSNVSPYAELPIAQRCYGIWAKGFLPLMLNLLTSLGATVAPEVTYVLKQFPHLLRASVDRFEAPGASRTKSKSDTSYITLVATSEIHSLALLTRVLGALRANNSRDIPAVEWDAAGLLENVEFWLSSKRLLKERLLPIGDRQMGWRNTKTTSIDAGGSDNLLGEKVVAQLEIVRDVLTDAYEG
jgi:nuclear pore complex protein Nup188